MAFQPTVGEILVIDGVQYRFTKHPNALDMTYGQTGRFGTVFQLEAPDGSYKALKVFMNNYRQPSLVAASEREATFADIPGLSVCRRTILTPQRHTTLLRQYPDLTYAALMPWISGPTWFDLLDDGKDFTPTTSLAFGRALLETLTRMEQQSIAHCDLAAANVIFPMLASPAPKGGHGVALVDVEQMYGPRLDRPKDLPNGTMGYNHRSITNGVWHEAADRFAGAVLLAEIISWCDSTIREASSEESFFDPGEIQRPGNRYDLLYKSLHRHWGSDTASLFEQTWWSSTLHECPTFGQWLVALPETVGHQAPSIQGSATGSSQSANTDEQTLRALYDLGHQLEQEGNLDGALSTYRQGYNLSSPDVSWQSKFKAAIHNNDLARSTPIPSHGSAKRIDVEPLPTWDTGIKSISRGAFIAKFLAACFALGLGLYALLAPGDSWLLNFSRDTLGSLGYSGQQSLGAGIIAALVATVQAWIFRQRLRKSKRWKFIAGAFAGGMAAGLVVGSIFPNGYAQVMLQGGLVGGIAGILSSLAQNTLLRHRESAMKWLLWNTASWCLIWAFAWNITSIAITIGVIVATTGIALALFLARSPEIEF
jgi:hypothetical protein